MCHRKIATAAFLLVVAACERQRANEPTAAEAPDYGAPQPAPAGEFPMDAPPLDDQQPIAGEPVSGQTAPALSADSTGSGSDSETAAMAGDGGDAAALAVDAGMRDAGKPEARPASP